MKDVDFVENITYDASLEIKPLENPEEYRMENPLMFKLARKIEHATQLHLVKRWSSTAFQITNYGLSGICESHLDPHGATEGVKVEYDRKDLLISGDMFVTFMAYLTDVRTEFKHILILILTFFTNNDNQGKMCKHEYALGRNNYRNIFEQT